MPGQHGTKSRLVQHWGQVEANIRTLEAARRSQSAQLRKEYEKLLEKGTCFVAYLSGPGIAFAPSKFIGYVDNDFDTHLRYRNNRDPKNPHPRHGGDTNRAIAKVLGRGPELNASAEEWYRNFCREMGFEPNESAPFKHRRKYWMTDRLVGLNENDAVVAAEEAAVAAIRSDPNLSQTEKEQLVKARLGQGRFREDLTALWKDMCCLTGCGLVDVLRASHIKPWRESDNRERLDKFNGLLLAPNADALFDKGYITFTDEGEILISKRLAEEAARLLLTNCRRRIEFFEENKPYLKYHRELHFQG